MTNDRFFPPGWRRSNISCYAIYVAVVLEGGKGKQRLLVMIANKRGVANKNAATIGGVSGLLPHFCRRGQCLYRYVALVAHDFFVLVGAGIDFNLIILANE